MKYPRAIRILHWSIALLVLVLGSVGIYMVAADLSQELHNTFYYWHKSFGMLVLILMLVRISVRLRSTIPELPEGLSANEKKAAKVSHRLLYLLAVTVPVLGYVQVSAYEGSHGAAFFFFELPQLVPDSETVFLLAHNLHRFAAYSLLALAFLHGAAAIKHRLFDRKENDVLNRML